MSVATPAVNSDRQESEDVCPPLRAMCASLGDQWRGFLTWCFWGFAAGPGPPGLSGDGFEESVGAAGGSGRGQVGQVSNLPLVEVSRWRNKTSVGVWVWKNTELVFLFLLQQTSLFCVKTLTHSQPNMSESYCRYYFGFCWAAIRFMDKPNPPHTQHTVLLLISLLLSPLLRGWHISWMCISDRESLESWISASLYQDGQRVVLLGLNFRTSPLLLRQKLIMHITLHSHRADLTVSQTEPCGENNIYTQP